MLENSFYTITQEERGDNSIAVTVRLDAGHSIFAGHFPGQPVVPGVCMMQIVKELLDKGTAQNTLLRHGSNIKFLNFIDPVKQPEVNITVQYVAQPDASWKVSANIRFGEIIFFKFQGNFISQTT
ncbi:3-hydroxyacyl-[acyl-carrier-protein] dehydratase [Chitinophaga costaii]|uniref:3-hydroxyacyl-[acyl-carrier-protein] dehydratase n=1 Tax=Chitinophaga costaii TaxID=1335309 RepID=A0A1C3ZH51_9BACT|nr:3-hydroxyacyl-ACP dehydratase [Chitinophaga costaii]SCB81572.1 3-hydroxyacyl-[acyl-carrier-protein] dehydratase [Chitinophaga costaii]